MSTNIWKKYISNHIKIRDRKPKIQVNQTPFSDQKIKTNWTTID